MTIMWRYCINVVMILAALMATSFSTPVVRDVLENREVNDVLLMEGDIIVPDVLGYNAAANVKKQWPNGIVFYEIERGHHCSSKILQEMKKFQKKSCIKFREWNSENDYVYFAVQKGCYSDVGRIGGFQPLSIGHSCCNTRDIQHQIMHALGFYHEHTRPDRDNYILINWNNIPKAYRPKFYKQYRSEVNTFNTDLDFQSVMMYSSNAFGTRTMVKKADNGVFGSPLKLSSTDWLRLNKYYNCKK